MTKPQSPRRRPRTEFRVPPPLLQRIDAVGFTGSDLLAEDGSDPAAAFVFWRCYRDTELWGSTADRLDLFWPGSADAREREIDALDAAVFGGIKPRLSGFVDLLRRPKQAEPERVAELCTAVAGWFEERGSLRCAVDFAVAAYLAHPQRAGLAVRVARLTRLLAEYPRSTSWFDHALYLARHSGDWQAYSEALAGLGNLHYQLGNLPRARLYHRRCLRVATRKHLREMIGSAYHNLFNVEMRSGRVELGQTFAEKAVEAYTPGSHRLVRLGRDLLHEWMLLGYFGQALSLALEMVHHFDTPVDRVQMWAGVGRASGGSGVRAVFEDAWIETLSLVRNGVADPAAADALIDLAHGAASLGDTQRAEHAARTALDIAARRREGHTMLVAEALLDSLRASAMVPARQPADAPDLQGEDLAIIRALREMRAAAV
jgi:tetratricopeptide (TPR) repeat protein